MADKQHADPDEPAEPSAPLTERVGDLLGDAVGAVRGRAAGVVGTAVDIAQDAARRWDERPGARVRRVRRLGATPLPYLYAVHPEARQASPRELGLKTIDVDLIAGTAVGGATQRGSDFLPLKPFRSQNWQARWQRIRLASDRLTILPPIDVLLYRGRYWVLDGHNRVAMALYAGQVGIDANVVELVPPGAKPSETSSVELVPPGAKPSERSGALAAVLTESRALRSAGEGHRVVGIDELPERDDDPDPERQRR